MNQYCVVATPAGWQVALLHGTLKQPEPGVYHTVRAAIAASRQRNMALWAAETRPVAAKAA